MEQTILPGDPVYVDIGIKSISGDGIYAIKRSTRTEFVRIQELGGNNIRLSKDSTNYQPVAGPVDEVLANTQIIGRALFSMRTVSL